jgi:hypothetical protein
MPDKPQLPLELLLVLEPEQDADAEEVERLGRQLRSELQDLNVNYVIPVAREDPPSGAKGGEAVSLMEWLITLSGTGGVLATVVATIKDWLGRRTGAQKIKLTIDGDSLELDAATPADRSELVEAFVRRHQGG